MPLSLPQVCGVSEGESLIGRDRLSLDDLLAALRAREPKQVFAATALIADRRITAECDDQLFFSEFFAMFGGSEPAPGRLAIPSDMHVDIRAHTHPKFGWLRMSGSGDVPIDAREFDFAVELDHGNFVSLAHAEPGWNCVAFRDSDVPAFAFRDADCLFALDERWRLSIVWYLFWRLLRLRSDAIFFHASALGIHGEGTIFVGPGGAGKSTTSLALAARGHNFLSDEVAGYLPETGELIPFRRPVGIKPGRRATAVERSLTPAVVERIERDGFVRVDVDTLFRVGPPQAVPLRRIVFLRGFAEQPRLDRISPGRREVVELQPLMSSFLNAPHSRRIFELTRLLSSAKVYQLSLGDPDITAEYLEEAFACEKSQR
jgi:hypothetical protein